jgi:hypothetical protein
MAASSSTEPRRDRKEQVLNKPVETDTASMEAEPLRLSAQLWIGVVGRDSRQFVFAPGAPVTTEGLAHRVRYCCIVAL